MFPVFEIKAFFELTWEDIPFIELPTFGHEHALAALFGRHDFLRVHVPNLDVFKDREVPHFHPHSDYHVIEQQLYYLFYQGHYFSVARHGIPFGATFAWRALETHPDGGEWYIPHRVYGDPLRQKLEDLAKRLGAQKRRMMAEQAESGPEPTRILQRSPARGKSEKNIPENVQPEPQGNPELEARANELIEIGKQIRSPKGFVPTSDEEIQHAINTGNLGNPRYLVSIQTSKSADEAIGYRRPDTGRTTMWTTTYDMIKKGDLSAPLLLALIGSTYDPATEYTMYIFDQGENFEQDGALTFSPTWENMQKYCPEELHKDRPKDPIRDKALLASVMNPDAQVKYQQTMEDFWQATEGIDKAEYNERHIKDYLAKKGFSAEQRTQFRARHLYRTQIGANAQFLGNGATEFTLHEKNRAAIEGDGISIKGKPGKLGVPEMLTIEKDPPSIAMLEKQGSLKSIPLKRGSV